jgi:hypothetical protein
MLVVITLDRSGGRPNLQSASHSFRAREQFAALVPLHRFPIELVESQQKGAVVNDFVVRAAPARLPVLGCVLVPPRALIRLIGGGLL